ncbi:DUF2812 domain-containing protein [Acidaminobacter sp. JC074]|uniref:DUF2812 domain-containing protein n=1 Tax=Acidaminobacter sp. JC074 TaxID=2530199 RepID=UPI001F0F54F4|nr:DUF2812 domain-containing protein [Acidaminobacter sp. JC074]
MIKIRSFHPLSKLDLELFLNKEAEKGYILESAGNMIYRFKKTERKVHYFAYPFYSHKAFQAPKTTPNMRIKNEMESSGYKYVASNSLFQIYVSDNEDSKHPLDEEVIGHDTLVATVKSDLFLVIMALYMLFSARNFDFPSLINLHILDQADMSFYFIRVLFYGLITLQIIVDLTWLIVNLIRKEKLWFLPVFFVKTFNTMIYLALVICIFLFASLLFYNEWKVLLGMSILMVLTLAFKYVSNRFNLSKKMNLILLVAVVVAVISSLEFISDIPTVKETLDKSHLLELEDFSYKGDDYEWEKKDRSMLVSYDYYFCKGSQEELMTLKAQCINDFVVDMLVSDIKDEYELSNHIYVKAGDLTDFISYYDGNYIILVKENRVYFLSGDIDLEDKNHQEIIKKKLEL